MKNGKIISIVQAMIERMPINAAKSTLFAFCDGVATTYQYFHYENNTTIKHDPSNLPSREIMDNILSVYKNNSGLWTAFVLHVNRDGSYVIDFHDDLNPTLGCSEALLWLEYIKYNIEPESDFEKFQLQNAIKAETFKETLNYACMKKDIDKIKDKLANVKKASLHKISNPGGTPLHIACRTGDIEIVKLLVEAGANLNIKYNGYTPLAVACSYGSKNVEIIKYLISKGGNVNELLRGKATPFHLLCASGSKEIIEYVLAQGVNIDAVTATKYSALHYAAESGNAEAAKTLIDNGINVELLENYKRSALHLACYRNKAEVVEVLLENGADVNRMRQDKITPMHTVCEQGFTEIVKILIKHNPDLTAKATFYTYPDNKKLIETPIQTAIRKGQNEIVDILKEVRV